jgi:hypothetical protein
MPNINVINVEYPKLGAVLANINSLISIILTLGFISKIFSYFSLNVRISKILLKEEY